MREPDPDPNLERWVDAQLKQLPPLKAPSALLPAVLDRLKTRAQRPWWLGVWWEWPVQAKIASILLGLTLTGVIGGGSILLDQPVAQYSEQVTERLSPVAAVAETGATLWSAVLLVSGHPLVLTVLCVGCAAYLVCIGLGTILVRSIKWKGA